MSAEKSFRQNIPGIMEEKLSGICGRKDELRVFDSFINAVAKRQAVVLSLYGGPGTGKTFMLRRLKAEAEKAGMLVLHINSERRENEGQTVEKFYNRTAEGERPLLSLRLS